MSYEYSFQYHDDENCEDYEVFVNLRNHHEPNYGADADGNRGRPADFVEVEEFIVYHNDQEVKDQLLCRRAERYFDKMHRDQAVEECAQAYHEPLEKEYDEFD
jgi:hypothetical protein